MELFDQHTARSRVERLLAEPVESALLVTGERGLGKSQLLDHLSHSCQLRTAPVRGRPEESQFPLSGFSAMFDAIRGEQGAGFGNQLRLRSESPDTVFSAAQDIAGILQGLRLDPTVVLIDDLDQMDVVSQALIGILAGRLLGTHLHLVATASRIDPAGPLTAIPSIGLKPLSPEQTLDVADMLDPAADATTIRILTGYVGGNPLVMAEQMAHTEAHQIAGVDWLTLPPRSTAAIRAIATPALAHLDPQSKRLLEAVALSPAAHRQAFDAIDPCAGDILDDLVAMTLVRSHGPYVSISDPRIRIHLYWGLNARERRELKQQIGELTEPYDTHLANWYAGFGQVIPGKIDDLLDASTQLVAQHRIDAAIELVEHALGRARSVQEHLPALIRLCTALLLAGETDLIERYGGRVNWNAPADDDRLALAALRLSILAFGSRRVGDEDAPHLQHLHGSADKDASGSLLTIAALHRTERWEVDEARAAFAASHDIRDEVSDPTRQKFAAVAAIMDGLEGIPAATETDATGPGPTAAVPRPDVLLLRARAFTWSEDHAEARRMLGLVTNHPHDRHPVWSQLATYGAVVNEIASGEFHLAREAIQAWAASTPVVGRGSSTQSLFLAWYHYAAGSYDDASDHIERALIRSSREASQSMRARALALRGTIGLLTGDPQSAVNDLRQVTSLSSRFPNPGLLRHWADYVEACLQTGRTQEAGAAHRALERRLTEHSTRWGILAHARITAMLAPDDSVVVRFSDAIKLSGAEDSPYELGRTQLAFADRLRSIGMESPSQRARGSAVSAFERCGAHIWTTRATTTSPKVSPVGGLAALSTEEQEIVERVQDGQRNREIAASLHLSVRTIELRLTHIYRTLDVRSRAELIAHMNEARFPSHRA